MSEINVFQDTYFRAKIYCVYLYLMQILKFDFRFLTLLLL